MQDDQPSIPGRLGEDLLAELYTELRQLAQARMRKLPAGNTLQPTALVHEAYMRLEPRGGGKKWDGRGHFFGAAARAMRQILVDQARRKGADKHGAGQERLDADDVEIPFELPVDDLLALDSALERLSASSPRQAQIVELRLFGGLERDEIAQLLNTSIRTIDREWATVVAKLSRELQGDDS